MSEMQPPETERKRAPSKRALATKLRVFDAAEKVFADRGFDGATIREIAAEAGEPVGTIHHHGGGKNALFHKTVARRAETLSCDRLNALQQVRSDGDKTLERVLAAFICPFFELSSKDPRWRDYARLVAFVSVDSRWQNISAECFDPVAEVFIEEISSLLPKASRKQIVEGFVYSVSAMLALLTSQNRMGALGAKVDLDSTRIDHLVNFCAAGFRV
ncbi:Transcriptional regulator, TetR family [Sulfitobacter noctilucicola]|uniref:AcrR family transcriptional regulator n=1 Tax=Sulfitobacter noctilucicola TaxID=1342301 RepID=A0A7W6Q472_9RHOB|nr:TetR family transcriptional regulator [Sulfitobacter noctilucicola]KIN63570.1 Transcriptional regulator, TetR family [Sulfitobacter noctilucicola]MBB4174920.1 AcrR family transcriptional regulator [Sulfitobacter noctilucicola]